MSVREGCFLIGVALLRISTAAEIAAWAAGKKRPEEADIFLSVASRDISLALGAGWITEGDAEKMRSSIKQHDDAVMEGNKEKVQDALAELSAKVHDIAFQKVVKCERE